MTLLDGNHTVRLFGDLLIFLQLTTRGSNTDKPEHDRKDAGLLL